MFHTLLLSPRNSVGGDIDIVTRPFVGGWVSEWVREWIRPTCMGPSHFTLWTR